MGTPSLVSEAYPETDSPANAFYANGPHSSEWVYFDVDANVGGDYPALTCSVSGDGGSLSCSSGSMSVFTQCNLNNITPHQQVYIAAPNSGNGCQSLTFTVVQQS